MMDDLVSRGPARRWPGFWPRLERLSAARLAALVFAAGLCLTLLGAAVGWGAGPIYERVVFLTDLASGRHLLYEERANYGASPLSYWDSDWYYNIAANGYRFDGRPGRYQNVAFFPAYPLVTRLLWQATGLPWTTVAVAVAWACMFGFLYVFALLARSCLSPGDAVFATLLAGLAPAAVFGFLAYPTSLIAFTSALALWWWRQGRPWWAALAAGVATASGSLGLAASGALVLAAARRARHGRFPWWQLPLLGLLSVSGLLAFMTFLDATFHRPLLFAEAQAAWQLPTTLPERLGRLALLEPFRDAVLTVPSRPLFLVNAVVFLGMAAALVVAARRLPAILVAQAALTLVLAALFSAAPTGRMGSMARICYSAGPAFLALALSVTAPRARRWLLGSSAFVFLAFAALFAFGVFVQ
ncbi:MAG TPA: mannosyltransferase family protein [Deinococcales bacterium]|nr:mannosyltransferase family protein [Deinococcales bacterium]